MFFRKFFIPECFLTVLSWCYLILFGIAIINYLQSPCLSLSDLCMLLLGMFLVDVNRVE